MPDPDPLTQARIRCQSNPWPELHADDCAWCKFVGTINVLALMPNDNVLLTIEHDLGTAQAEMLDQLRQRFPGVKFTVMGGVSGVAIQRAALAEPYDDVPEGHHIEHSTLDGSEIIVRNQGWTDTPLPLDGV